MHEYDKCGKYQIQHHGDSILRMALAVTQYLAEVRYNDEALFEILGGRKAMIESPLMQELKKEWTEDGKHEGLPRENGRGCGKESGREGVKGRSRRS